MNGSNERIPRRRLLKDVAALATAGVFFPQILARHAVGAETIDKAGILGFSCIPLCFWKEMYTEKTTSYEDWIRMAVEFGLDGTEVFEPFTKDLDASARARLAEFIHDAGLKVSMYTVDIRGVFSVLKNGGYDGWISLEPLAGGKEDLRFSVGHVRDAWRKA